MKCLVAEHVDGVVKVGVGVLVEDRIGVEQLLVPRDADVQVADGQRNVGERRKLGHEILLSCWCTVGRGEYLYEPVVMA